MKLKPLSKNVLVKPIAPSETTAGGLHMVVDAESQKIRRGVVIATGAEVPQDVQVGDTLLFIHVLGGAKVQLAGVEHLLVDYENALGVEEPDKAMATVA
jgi:co-chaperonin GroES (HSP10)